MSTTYARFVYIKYNIRHVFFWHDGFFFVNKMRNLNCAIKLLLFVVCCCDIINKHLYMRLRSCDSAHYFTDFTNDVIIYE